MKRLILAALALASCAQPALNVAGAAEYTRSFDVESALVCCSATEASTLRDLIYIARVQLNPPADVTARLVVLAQALAAGTYRSWSDPDRAGLLALIASTADGKYWKATIDEFASTIGAGAQSPSTPAPQAVVIPSTGSSVPGLTASQIADVVQCLTDGVNAGYPIAAVRDRVKSELAASVYSYGDRSVIDAAKLWYYSGSAGANRSALYAYLAIIDQRDPNNTNVTLAIGDPRWKKVGGASVATNPPAITPPSAISSSTTNLTVDQVRAIVVEELAKLPAAGTGTVASDATGGGHYAALAAGAVDLKANTMRNATQDGITSSYCGQLQMNGWDGGLRESQNYQWSCTPELPYAVWGGDSKAAWSYSQAPRQSVFQGLAPAVTYGQSFVLDGGWSQSGYDYATGAALARGVLFAAQRGGEGLLFAVTPSRSVGQFPTNRVVMRLNSDGSADPAEIVIGGQLRRLKSCNVGGVTVVCF